MMGQLLRPDEPFIPQLDKEGTEKVSVCKPVNRSDLYRKWISVGELI